jgi:hypothetical protein
MIRIIIVFNNFITKSTFLGFSFTNFFMITELIFQTGKTAELAFLRNVLSSLMLFPVVFCYNLTTFFALVIKSLALYLMHSEFRHPYHSFAETASFFFFLFHHY